MDEPALDIVFMGLISSLWNLLVMGSKESGQKNRAGRIGPEQSPRAPFHQTQGQVPIQEAVREQRIRPKSSYIKRQALRRSNLDRRGARPVAFA